VQIIIASTINYDHYNYDMYSFMQLSHDYLIYMNEICKDLHRFA